MRSFTGGEITKGRRDWKREIRRQGAVAGFGFRDKRGRPKGRPQGRGGTECIEQERERERGLGFALPCLALFYLILPELGSDAMGCDGVGSGQVRQGRLGYVGKYAGEV